MTANVKEISGSKLIEVSIDDFQKLVENVASLETALTAKANFIVGEIRLMPFRKNELPEFWHYPSGIYVALDSDIGRVLNSFSDNYKSDWGIVVANDTIRMFNPDKFFSGTNGRFPRPVNGSSRQPGSVENDAIRNITGAFTAWIYMNDQNYETTQGSINLLSYLACINPASQTTTGIGWRNTVVTLNTSLQVPTAAENRPYNVGFTPAVYLGV